MPVTEIDHAAAAREGLIPVLCGGRQGKCGKTLAHQTPDHNTLVPNGAASISRGRVGLRCRACGGITEWRASRGTKPRQNRVT